MNALRDQPSRGRMIVVVSAAVVVVVLIVAVVVAVVSSRGGDDTNTPATPSAAPSSEEQDPSAEPSAAPGFGTPTADYTGRAMLTPNNPAGAPRGELRGGIEDPCGAVERDNPADDVAIEDTAPATLWSVGDGPERIEHGAPAGYSKSPRGAALAVWNAWMALQRNDDGTKWIVTNRLAVSNEERNALLETTKSGPLPADSPDRTQIAPAGYQLKSCSPDYMVIDVARPVFVDEKSQKLAEPEFYALRFGAVWEDGDWKLQTEPMKNSPGAVKNLDGWTRWAL